MSKKATSPAMVDADGKKLATQKILTNKMSSKDRIVGPGSSLKNSEHLNGSTKDLISPLARPQESTHYKLAQFK